MSFVSALFGVSDKTGLVEFARNLASVGLNLGSPFWRDCKASEMLVWQSGKAQLAF